VVAPFYLTIFLIVFTAGQSFASVDCSNSKSVKDFYECALKADPAYKSSNLTKSIARASRDALTKWPNPKLEVKSISGENAGENVGGTEVGISLSISDILVKRPALARSGRAEEKIVMIDGEENEFKAKTQLIRELFRYRQATDELELVDEALTAFKKIEQQFKSRSARGPEQEITLNLVELAQGDYQLRKNHLSVELSEIQVKFKGIFGPKFSFKNEWLPKLKQDWPTIDDSIISKNTFELRKLEAERDKHEAEQSLASAEAWPTIEAGPIFERNTEGPAQYNSVGFNVSVDLPLFNLNGGARAVSRANYERAKLNHDYGIKRAELDHDLLIRKYTTAVDSLKQSPSGESLNKKHRKIDYHFRQGLTSGSTVIEAHRQIGEFVESQHEHELVALESLMYIYQLSGLEPSEVLK
jgi:outer membrane protein TolC